MSPEMIALSALLLILFAFITITAARANGHAHKCVYPAVPHCYTDWICPSDNSTVSGQNMHDTLKSKKDQLQNCYTKKSDAEYLKDPDCGCKDPSYNYTSSGGNYESATVPAVQPGSSLSSSVPQKLNSGSFSRGNATVKEGSPINTYNAPLYCGQSQNAPTLVAT